MRTLFVLIKHCIQYIYIVLKCALKNRNPFMPFCKYENIHIVMNGPSFKDEFPVYKTDLINSNVMCSNHFVKTPYYEELKPAYYILADSAFWNKVQANGQVDSSRIEWLNKVCSETIDTLISKTTWKLNLFLPESSNKNKEFLKKISQNKNIKVITFNTTNYIGPNFKKYAFWSKQKCCPPIYNVLIGAIYLAIIMHFKKIFIYGADHNYFNNLFVDNDNKVYECNEHFYNDDSKKVLASNPMGEKENIGSLLNIYSMMWNSYYELDTFAKYCNSTIINCTKNSMIDAFERLYGEKK